MIDFAAEEIPDSDTLYYRVHTRLVEDQGGLNPNVIRSKEGCLSTDWSRYSTAEESQTRQDPAKNGIIGFPVKGVRSIDPLAVGHAPLSNNRSHTEILGFDQPGSRAEQKKLSVRLRLELHACIQGGTWLVTPGLHAK